MLDNLAETAQSLQEASWRPSRTLCFVTTRPKAREIHAADFKDRVVHHLLVPRLEALFEPVFIHDSYSNRKGKGTHGAVDRLQTFMRQITKNGKCPAHYLQLDIRNFFNSIDRRILFGIIRRRVGKMAAVASVGWGEQANPSKFSTTALGFVPYPSLPFGTAGRMGGAPVGTSEQATHQTKALETRQLLWLTRVILTGNAGESAIQRGAPALFARVPPHKRLKNAPPGKGLPIGNLTSQFFANVYLDRLDQFVKHGLKCRHYLRYVDDFILLHESAEQLAAWREQIIAFLKSELELELRDAGKLRPVTDGADFLGYIVRPDYRLVRRRVVGALREKLEAFQRRICRSLDEAAALSPTLPQRGRGRLLPLPLAGEGWRNPGPPPCALPGAPGFRSVGLHPGYIAP